MVRDRLNESEFETVITGMESINSTSSKQRVKSRTYLTDAIFFILFNPCYGIVLKTF